MLWYICTGLLAAFILYVIKVLATGNENDGNNSLEAFLVAADVTVVKNKRENVRQKYYRKYSEPGRPVLLLYGTEYGFSEEIARKLFDRLEGVKDKYDLQPRLVNMKDHECLDFLEEQLVFLVVSTAGDGVPPTDARAFFECMEDTKVTLSHLHYSVLALGDSNYPHFCRAGRTLQERFAALGGQCLVNRVDIDQEDWTSINSWIAAVTASLDTVQLESKLDYLQLPQPTDEDGISRTSPYMATLKVKYDLTNMASQDDKETIHCEFDVTDSGITWTSGDALGIYAENSLEDVNRLLKTLSSSGDIMVPVPHWAYQPAPEGLISARECLQRYYDLKSVRVELLELISVTGVESAQADIKHLLNGTTQKEKLQQFLSEHEVADVLQVFASAARKLGLQDVLQVMRQLQPRYYSISSSPLKDSERVCVTAAVVRYQLLGLARTGVCTTYLQDRLTVGDTCPVFISHNPDFRLPQDPHIPIIMVGPGTGIAPFRAFIQERDDPATNGLNLLYFGCRHKNQDYLYREELENLAAKNVIQLRVAFSRDQQEKIYVQDLIKEDGDQIWNLIDKEGAHVYVCGDARHMARDVDQALCHIVMTHGAQSSTHAASYLHSLEKQGRYQKDVWVT